MNIVDTTPFLLLLIAIPLIAIALAVVGVIAWDLLMVLRKINR